MNEDIMLKCTQVNMDYMRLPSGKVDGLENLTDLYSRLARQSNECARDWKAGSPCPKHEPAVDAFWWGVVAWADGFGNSVLGVGDQSEWGNVFIYPHLRFAEYLKPLDRNQVVWHRNYGEGPEPLPIVSGPPAYVILKLDSLWMQRVVQLTAKWGFFAHFKDQGALPEAKKLGDDLMNTASPARQAYLESDIKFFKALFVNFPFSQGIKERLDQFIAEAKNG